MFVALLLLGLSPTIYTTLRVFFMGDMPGSYSYSIAGQLSWVSLIFEVVSEAIVLPLYFFIGKAVSNKKELTNRVKTGLLVTFGIYTFFAAIVMIFAEPLLNLMAADPSIIAESVTYIRIECVAYIFSTLLSFALVVLTAINREIYLCVFTGIKLALCIVLDTFLVSTLKCSANLGVNGIGMSNIIVNVLLTVVVLLIFQFKENLKVFNKERMSFIWMKDFLKRGGISGLESLVRNLFYMLMICRMVNAVGEQGTYWVANNFIWGWLLLPITQLGELIKRDSGAEKNALQRKTLGYFAITFIVCLLWLALIPAYKPFMQYVLNYSDVDKLYGLVMILIGFYITYAFQNVFDCTFYGLGKTHYMLWESIVTNCTYYAVWFILYQTGVWTPDLTSIAIMFGAGCAFDAVVSGVAYAILLKKHHINILDVYCKEQTEVSN
jgi:Na+-driven multidrug efflux pump